MSTEARLKELFYLRDVIDGLLEESLLARHSVGAVVGRFLPKVCEAVGAKSGFLETYGEDLTLTLFSSPSGLIVPRWPEVEKRTGEQGRERLMLDDGEELVIAQPLDVAGEWFGRAGLVIDKSRNIDTTHAAAVLNLACEELDNFLFSIKAAREKHNIMMELGDALRHRVLAEGLSQAVEILSRAIPLDRMLMVFLSEEGLAASLQVQLYERAQSKASIPPPSSRSLALPVNVSLDTMGSPGADAPEVRRLGRKFLFDGERGLLERLGFERAQEEVLINGVTHSVVVGKVLVTSATGSFNTYDREILSGFAGFVRQRIVDFNKEWRRLAASFSPDAVARLVQQEDYENRFLAPREERVAILYVDIAGFTRLSEQVLKTPAAVAKLVERWSEQAVASVWKHGGVFDKMVGDCIIALFGPPFYEESPGQRLLQAIECAVDIRAMTTALPQEAGFEILREGGVAVSTGVNLAPLFVGTFGPNSNFTGFSSGMNNTARLQGCATRDQILVMEEVIAELPKDHSLKFGEQGSQAVKNVAQPLRFRALL